LGGKKKEERRKNKRPGEKVGMPCSELPEVKPDCPLPVGKKG